MEHSEQWHLTLCCQLPVSRNGGGPGVGGCSVLCVAEDQC